MRTGREVVVILHDIEVVGSLLAWRARDSNTLWHLTAVIVHGQGVVVGVYEQVVWPQCVKTRCQGRRVGDTGCLSAGGGEVNVWVVTRNAVQRYKSHGHRDAQRSGPSIPCLRVGAPCTVTMCDPVAPGPVRARCCARYDDELSTICF